MDTPTLGGLRKRASFSSLLTQPEAADNNHSYNVSTTKRRLSDLRLRASCSFAVSNNYVVRAAESNGSIVFVNVRPVVAGMY